jgi:pimeloyl-ACP methyl ester carboxylesterase
MAAPGDASALSRSADRYFDSAGVPIRYIERGHGDPVVLVHSYTGDLERQWIETGVLDALAPSYRVIAFDARGHGRSGKPPSPQAYGAEMAWDVVRLLDHLGIRQAHMVGYSMGAHILVQLLTLTPERFLTAILGGASGRLEWTAEDEERAQAEAKEMEQGLLTSQTLRLWPSDQPAPDTAEIKKRSTEFLDGQDCYALAAVRRSNRFQVVHPDDLRRVNIPVLGIVGSADPYRPHFDEIHERIAAFTLVVLDGATHLSAPTHPGFVPTMLQFLCKHARGDATT